ncbi:hypothetical protein FG379_003096 [Cryptosporidium bovis]|uniref:uncharacterized protein n=1 Tax=Cryptosporidium bovis TaxID=310047 RepID=UPI00351A7E2C|nr:hypothetical protein FG379_003096 [Cryptosporidium bovis]
MGYSVRGTLKYGLYEYFKNIYYEKYELKKINTQNGRVCVVGSFCIGRVSSRYCFMPNGNVKVENSGIGSIKAVTRIIYYMH